MSQTCLPSGGCLMRLLNNLIRFKIIPSSEPLGVPWTEACHGPR
jgi:hypothetical protein